MLQDDEIIQWAKTDAFAKNYLKNIPMLRQLYANNNRATTVLELDPLINGQKCELILLPVDVYNYPDQLWSKQGGKANENTAEEDKYLAHGTKWTCLDVTYDGTDQKEAQVDVQRAPWEMDSLKDLELFKPYVIIGEYQVTPGKDGKTFTAVHPLEVRPFEGDSAGVPNREVSSADEAAMPSKTAKTESAQHKEQINQQVLILVEHEVKQQGKLTKKSFDYLAENFGEYDVVEATKAHALRKQDNGDYVK